MSKNNFNQNNSKLSFDVQSNMINDECYVDAYLKQTQGPGEYKTSNLRSTVCEAPFQRFIFITSLVLTLLMDMDYLELTDVTLM